MAAQRRDDIDSARGLFAARLRLLYSAAGNPTLQRVACAAALRMQAARGHAGGDTTAQRISDWRAGHALPKQFESFEPVLLTLIELARAATEPVPEELLTLRAWKRLWASANSEKVAARPTPKRKTATARPTVTTALRRDTLHFVGRDAELRRILTATKQPGGASVYTIDGMPGVGKTAFAIHAAHLLADQFPDGRYLIELKAHSPGRGPAKPEDVLATLLTDVGVDPRHLPGTLDGRRDLWLDRSTGKRILLILDDARDYAQIEPLLPAEGNCLTLITSRRRLVALEGAVPLSLDVLDLDNAVELFCQLAHRTPAGTDRRAVEDIVRLCGFLPLALVLLAGRLAHHPSWTIGELAAEFSCTEDRLSELDTGPSAVRAAFTMSYRNLSADRQRLLRYLGLHPGGDIDAYAAAALADIPVPQAESELHALYIDHTIIETTAGRYRLHDLLRDYVRTPAHAGACHDSRQAVDRLLVYYRRTATAADRYLARRTRPVRENAPADESCPVREFHGDTDALAWMRRERANLLACLEHVDAARSPWVIELTGALAGLLERDGPWPEACRLHLRAIAVAQKIADPLGEANARSDLGLVRERTGECDAATIQHVQALAIYREIGNRCGEANALGNLGFARERIGDHAEAADLHQQALALHRSVGDRLGEATTLNKLGIVRMWTGRYADATDLHQQALTIFRELGNRSGEASALTNVSVVRLWTGDYDEATRHLRRALHIYRQIGVRYGEANVLANLGIVRTWTAHYADATAVLQQALTMYCDIGNRCGEASAMGGLGFVCVRTGDYGQAAELLRHALIIHRSIRNRIGEAQTLNGIGKLCLETGESHRALEVFTEARQLAQQLGNRLEHARALEGVARSRADLGDIDTAVHELRRAVGIYHRIGAPDTDCAGAYLATLEVTARAAERR